MAARLTSAEKYEKEKSTRGNEDIYWEGFDYGRKNIQRLVADMGFFELLRARKTWKRARASS